ncbi:hypothetical protein OAO24_00730 [Methylophilaceae bacterium]|jgi:hypothetical protein|nr:hypothetical protein [Methylophilaceae bacterium]
MNNIPSFLLSTIKDIGILKSIPLEDFSKLTNKRVKLSNMLVNQFREKSIHTDKNFLFIHNALKNTGIYVKKNYIKKTDIKKLKLFMEEKKPKNNIFNLKKIGEKFSFFPSNHLIKLINYLACNDKNCVKKEYFDTVYQDLPLDLDNAQELWHMDTFHPTLKYWITLSDWTLDSGPLEYCLKSNSFSNNFAEFYSHLILKNFDDNTLANFELTEDRTKKAWKMLTLNGSPRCKTNEEFMDIAEEYGYKQTNKFISVVPSGTLILADTSGFHRRGIQNIHRGALHGSIRFNPFGIENE